MPAARGGGAASDGPTSVGRPQHGAGRGESQRREAPPRTGTAEGSATARPAWGGPEALCAPRCWESGGVLTRRMGDAERGTQVPCLG